MLESTNTLRRPMPRPTPIGLEPTAPRPLLRTVPAPMAVEDTYARENVVWSDRRSSPFGTGRAFLDTRRARGPKPKPKPPLWQRALDGNRTSVRTMRQTPTEVQQAYLRGFTRHFAQYRDCYEEIANATGVPAALIAAMYCREAAPTQSRSGEITWALDSYLHNGQKLGKATTVVPKGVYFQEHQWREAAVDALTGWFAGSHRKYTNRGFAATGQYFATMRDDEHLAMGPGTSDLATLATFAEVFNGLGARQQGMQSSYVWAGTSIDDGGRYSADGKYVRDKDDKPGVVAYLLALRA